MSVDDTVKSPPITQEAKASPTLLSTSTVEGAIGGTIPPSNLQIASSQPSIRPSPSRCLLNVLNLLGLFQASREQINLGGLRKLPDVSRGSRLLGFSHTSTHFCLMHYLPDNDWDDENRYANVVGHKV